MALFTPSVGYGSLIEDKYIVLGMIMHEINLGSGAVGGSPWETLNRAVNHGCCPWKGHMVLFCCSMEQLL